MEGANSRELDPTTPYAVIDLMDDQIGVEDKGATMRLGACWAQLQPGSQVAAIYGSEIVSERHRHRYEVNPKYRDRLVAAGLCCSGASPDARLVEFIELPGHPYWIATQAHPEFKSRPDRPHPLFRGRSEPPSTARTSAPRGFTTSTMSPPDPEAQSRGFELYDPASPGLDKGAFRLIGERSRYKGERLSVVVGTFVGPDGFTFEREIVRTFDAVCVVPLESDRGHVLLVRQYRGPVDQALLELPAGKLDVEGEPPELCAGARELKEEVGAEAERFTELGRFFISPGFCDEQSICYLAEGLKAGPREADGIEEAHMVIERIALSSVEELIAAGDIVDAKTIVGLFLARSLIAGAPGSRPG